MNKFKLKFLTILFAALLIFSNAPSAAAAGSLYVVTVCRDANAVEILDGETLKSLARIAVGELSGEVTNAAGEVIRTVADQVEALVRDGYHGAISLETHWRGPDGDRLEASTICGRNLQALVST